MKVAVENESYNANTRGNGQIRSGKTSLSKTKQIAKSFDATTTNTSYPSIYPIASKHEVYSYGQRESLNRTRFLLVRTIASDGKENFKRVTFPGFGSVDTLKLIIEKAMKKGKVLEVTTIPDKLKIETNEQIRNMANHQKVEVVFDSSAATNYSRKFSLDEAEIARSKRLPMSGQKYFTEENPKKPVFWTNYSKDYGTSSLNENTSSSVSGDNETHITTSEPIPEEVPIHTDVGGMKPKCECVFVYYTLHARSSTSAVDITLCLTRSCKQMISLQATKIMIKEMKESSGFLKVANDGKIGSNSVETNNMMLNKPTMGVREDCSTIYFITEFGSFATLKMTDGELMESDCNGILAENSRKHTFQIAVMIGCLIGFSGLTYIFCRK